MNFIIRLLVTAAVAFGLAHLLKGIHIDTYWTALVFALIPALVNLIVRAATDPAYHTAYHYHPRTVFAGDQCPDGAACLKTGRWHPVDGFWWLYCLVYCYPSSHPCFSAGKTNNPVKYRW